MMQPGLAIPSSPKLEAIANVRVRIGNREYRFSNIVTTAGLNWIMDFMARRSVPAIEYFAVGTGTAPPALGDTRLGVEQFRKEFTNIWREPGLVVVETYFAMNEANFNWTEIGLVAGGSDDKDTGILIARVSADVNKTEYDSAVVTWELGVSNA